MSQNTVPYGRSASVRVAAGHSPRASPSMTTGGKMEAQQQRGAYMADVVSVMRAMTLDELEAFWRAVTLFGSGALRDSLRRACEDADHHHAHVLWRVCEESEDGHDVLELVFVGDPGE